MMPAEPAEVAEAADVGQAGEAVEAIQNARRSPYPLGVLVVMGIAAVRALGIAFELLDVQGFAVVDWIRSTGPVPHVDPETGLGLVTNGVLVGVLAASILTIVGLLMRRRWAWVLSIVTAGFILALDLGWWYEGDARYGSMLVNVIAVFYLNQRDVRLALRGDAVEP
jgi:hypothetical protein